MIINLTRMLESMESAQPWEFGRRVSTDWLILGFFLITLKLVCSPFLNSGNKSLLLVDLLFGIIIGGWLAFFKNKVKNIHFVIFLALLALFLCNSRLLMPLPLGAILGINALIFGIIIFCFFYGLLSAKDAYRMIFRISTLATLMAFLPILIILIYGFFVELILNREIYDSDGILMLVIIALTLFVSAIFGLFFWCFKNK